MPDEDLKTQKVETKDKPLESKAAPIPPQTTEKPPRLHRVPMEMIISNADDDPVITIQQAQRGFHRTLWVDDFGYWSIQYYLQQFYQFLQEDAASDILIMVNSYGGSVDALLPILDAIKSSPVDVRTCAVGPAMSCGAILLSAGTKGKRYCLSSSRVMIHEVSGMAWGNIADVKNDINEMERINRVAMTALAENCGMTYEKLIEVLRSDPEDKREFYFDAAGAKEFGIIDEVTESFFDIIPQKAKKEPTTEVVSDGE